MGKQALIGVAGLLANPAGDLANYVVSGSLTNYGPGIPFQVVGPFNLFIYASINTALTTTANTTSASVASGTGLAAGVAINSVNVPPGTTYGTFSGTSGNLAFPTVTLACLAESTAWSLLYNAPGSTFNLAQLVGATVTGPGVPTGTTVLGVNTTTGAIQLSAQPTASQPTSSPQFFSFALTNSAVTAGTDSKAIFTGAGIAWSGTVNIERSFDGGSTWVVANSGGAGTLAQFTAGPVALSFGEPERGILYRINCISYSSGTINYRFSASGSAAMSLGINQLT